MPVLRAFRFNADATAGAGTKAALAAAKPPSRAENAQTRRSAEVGERERRPSGEPKRRQTAKEPPRLARSHGGRFNLVFLVTHIIPSKNSMLNQRVTYFPTRNGGHILYEILTYRGNIWDMRYKSPMGARKNTCSSDELLLNREELLLLSEFQRSERRNSSVDAYWRGFSRAKKRVFELIAANPDLNMFCTFTVQFGRDDYATIIKRLGQWLDNRVRRKGLRYVLVPEFHDDAQSIHFHGVFNESALALENSGKRSGRKVVYNLPEWGLGFASAVRIGAKDVDPIRCAKYIADYMLKENFGRVGGRFYLHGGNLAEPMREYFSADYDAAQGEEITVGGNFSFKLKRFL